MEVTHLIFQLLMSTLNALSSLNMTCIPSTLLVFLSLMFLLNELTLLNIEIKTRTAAFHLLMSVVWLHVALILVTTLSHLSIRHDLAFHHHRDLLNKIAKPDLVGLPTSALAPVPSAAQANPDFTSDSLKAGVSEQARNKQAAFKKHGIIKDWGTKKVSSMHNLLKSKTAFDGGISLRGASSTNRVRCALRCYSLQC